MHKFATICLAGALCFGFSGIRAEASSLSLAAEEGIASVMTEAQAADPEADEKVLEDMTPSEFDGICIARTARLSESFMINPQAPLTRKWTAGIRLHPEA